MKKQILFRMLSSALVLFLFTAISMAQVLEDKTAKEKEMKAKQAELEKQHMEMKEQQIKMKELEIVFEEEFRVPEMARQVERARSAGRVYSWSDDNSPHFIYTSGQENQSQLTLRNSFDGDSDSSEGEFDVDESTTHIRCLINGKVKSGRISIRVCYPNGKVFKELSITSSAEMSFTQSLSIKEENKNKYTGSWTYEVEADEAKGSYTLSFTTH